MTSPLLLLAVGVSLGACHLISKKNAEQKSFTIAGHELGIAQQYGVIALISLPLFYIAGAGSVVFWVLGKLHLLNSFVIVFYHKILLFYTGASMFFIVLHASFYHNDAIEEAFELPLHIQQPPIQEV